VGVGVGGTSCGLLVCLVVLLVTLTDWFLFLDVF
jgi:hypothetical protein